MSRDGQRLLMVKDNTPGDRTASAAKTVVVINWLEELKAKVPTGR